MFWNFTPSIMYYIIISKRLVKCFYGLTTDTVLISKYNFHKHEQAMDKHVISWVFWFKKKFNVQHVYKTIIHGIVNWCLRVTQNIPEDMCPMNMIISQQYTSTNKVISDGIYFRSCECFRVKNENLSMKISYIFLSISITFGLQVCVFILKFLQMWLKQLLRTDYG